MCVHHLHIQVARPSCFLYILYKINTKYKARWPRYLECIGDEVIAHSGILHLLRLVKLQFTFKLILLFHFTLNVSHAYYIGFNYFRLGLGQFRGKNMVIKVITKDHIVAWVCKRHPFLA